MASQEIEVYEAESHVPATLIPSESPKEFLEHAGKVASALIDLVNKEHLFTQVGRGKHLHVDAWTSLGSLLGSVGGKSVYAVPDGDPEPVEIDGVKGFRARMKAVTIDGQVVGGATGYCMRDEPTWKNRPFYALAGMAETRATSRALRKPLGFIVRLAGYAATAYEEMPRDGELIEDAEVEGTPFSDSQFQAPTTARGSKDPAETSDAQRKMLYRLKKKLVEEMGQPEEAIQNAIVEAATKAQASELITKLKKLAGES